MAESTCTADTEGEEDGEHKERRSRPWWLCGRRRLGERLQDPEERRLPRPDRPEPDHLTAGRRPRKPAHSGPPGRARGFRPPLLLPGPWHPRPAPTPRLGGG